MTANGRLCNLNLLRIQAATREDLYEQTIISLTKQLDVVSSTTRCHII